MEHGAEELYGRRLVRVLFVKRHDESECAVFKGCVGGADDDRIPVLPSLVFGLGT